MISGLIHGISTMCFALSLCLVITGAAWVYHLQIKNAGVIDVAWGVNLALMSIIYATSGPGWLLRRYLIALMVTCAGLRLSYYLWNRTIGQPEDPRCVRLRRRWGANSNAKFFGLAMLGTCGAAVASMPLLVAAWNTARHFSFCEVLGVVLFAGSIIGESVADSQLREFRENPDNKSRTLMTGLWKYSRHPNYFFEFMTWVSYWLFACGSPWGLLTVFAPLGILYALLNVTGIPYTEAECIQTKGESYRNYQNTTSPFIPWFPKEKVESDVNLPREKTASTFLPREKTVSMIPSAKAEKVM